MKKSNNFLIYLIESKEIPFEDLTKAGVSKQLVYLSERQGSETSLSTLRRIFASLSDDLQSKFLVVFSRYLKLKQKGKLKNASKSTIGN